jgi:hypothetical protein
VRPLPEPAIFTREQARLAGWSDAALTRAVRSGRLLRLRRGLFTTHQPSDPLLAARAAALACRGSVVSHRSATALRGVPLLHRLPDRPDLTVPPDHTGDVRGALLHRATLLDEEVTHLDGTPVTAMPRTLIDLARTVTLAAGVVSVDAALHQKLVTKDELRAVIERCQFWPNVRRAARTVALADGRAESPLESVSRLVLDLRLHLPRPQPQGVIRDKDGLIVGRCDFYWDEFGVFGEADGRSKYTERDVLTDEKGRQEDLENLGLIAVRWGWRDVRYDQQRLRRRIFNAFERGRLRDASGFPRLWSVDPP